jgi:hypothetical protein
MTIQQKIDPAGALWVFTAQESAVAAALRAGAMAKVAIAEPADSLFATRPSCANRCLSGR